MKNVIFFSKKHLKIYDTHMNRYVNIHFENKKKQLLYHVK